tara:strand:- start:579 stop:782 length:204 start_codon:yes stop_codon:yes gene_type:complete
MTKPTKKFKAIVEFHKQIDAIETMLIKLDVCPAKNVEFDDKCKTIYGALQDIKALIYDDKIVYRREK